jgi:hypothetical protein
MTLHMASDGIYANANHIICNELFQTKLKQYYRVKVILRDKINIEIKKK